MALGTLIIHLFSSGTLSVLCGRDANKILSYGFLPLLQVNEHTGSP